MGLETGNYISDLVVTNPLSTDKRRFGDDHFRLIKDVLKKTFPNANGVINPTPTELNYLVGVTSAVQTQIDSKLASAALDGLIQAYNYAAIDVANVWTRTQAIAPIDLGDVNGVVSLDVAATTGYIMTLIGNVTVVFSNAQAGQEITIKVTQGGAGSFTITWPATMDFPNKTAPTLSTTAGDYDVIVAKVLDGRYVGNIVKDLG